MVRANSVHAILLITCILWAAAPAWCLKKKEWTLEHRLLHLGGGGSTSWSVRGVLSMDIDDDDDSVQLEMKNENTSDLAVCTEFAKHAANNNSSLYQLKVVEEDGREIVTSVPTCHLQRANYRDELQVVLQESSGSLLSLVYVPLISPLAPERCAEPFHESFVRESIAFDTTQVTYDTHTPAMLVGKHNSNAPKVSPPPGLKWMKGPASQSKRRPGETADDEPPSSPGESGLFGFLKRYWYIFVPLMILNLITAEAPPTEQQQQQQQQQQQPRSATERSSAASASPSNNTKVRRRGKRD